MDVKARLNTLRLFVFDVDGVLTDGRIVLDNQGNELKFFDVRDGHGVKLLAKAGLRTGLLTARRSEVVARRAAELGIDYVVQGSGEKGQGLVDLAAQAAVTLDQVGYMGDDLVDLPALLRAGFAAAPADAHEEVRARVHYVAKAAGGRGAVREVAEQVLHARGLWDFVLGDFVGL